MTPTQPASPAADNSPGKRNVKNSPTDMKPSAANPTSTSKYAVDPATKQKRGRKPQPTTGARDGLITLAVIVCLVISVVSGLFALRSSATHEPDSVAFNRTMITHHNQAVAMALIMVRRGDDNELITLAQDILLTQQAQIGQMTARLETARASMYGETHKMPGMASPAKIAELEELPVPAAQVSMLKLMIAHHRGGVEMANDALKGELDAPSRRLALAIIAGQQAEMTAMETMLARLSGANMPVSYPNNR